MREHKGNFTCVPLKTRKKVNDLLFYTKNKSLRTWIMITLQLNLGLRISDIVKLTFEHFEGTHIELIEEKTGKIQRIKISEALRVKVEEFSELQGDSKGFILKSRVKGRPISTRMAQMELKKIGEDLGFNDFSSHSLRKTFGYFAYKASKNNLILLMNRFNHSKPAMTLRYIGITQEDLDGLSDLVSF